MACSLFDPYPKDSRENFFDRENLINEIEKLVDAKFWPLLIGPKRVGKTSIVKIVVRELDGIYLDATGVNSLKQLGGQLMSQMESLKLTFDIKVLRLELEKRPVLTLERLLSSLGDRVIGIDEIQNIATPWLSSVLSTAYNTARVRFIFTGSMIGLSKILTGGGKLMGRPILEKEVSPMSLEESIQFLEEGKRRCKLELTRTEMEDVALNYQGITGWLTYYGNLRSIGYDHEMAKSEVSKIALRVVKGEYERLGEVERAVLKALTLLNHPDWKSLKKVTEALLGREIKDWSFSHALKQLVNARIVRKVNDHYELVDPMYKELLKT